MFHQSRFRMRTFAALVLERLYEYVKKTQVFIYAYSKKMVLAGWCHRASRNAWTRSSRRGTWTWGRPRASTGVLINTGKPRLFAAACLGRATCSELVRCANLVDDSVSASQIVDSVLLTRWIHICAGASWVSCCLDFSVLCAPRSPCLLPCFSGANSGIYCHHGVHDLYGAIFPVDMPNFRTRRQKVLLSPNAVHNAPLNLW